MKDWLAKRPLPRAIAPAGWQLSTAPGAGGRIPLAALMIERARAGRSLAASVKAAFEASGMSIATLAARTGMPWRVIHNILATGMWLLPKRELKGFWDMVDLGTAMGRRVEFTIESRDAIRERHRAEVRSGRKPYGYEWGPGGRRALFAGMRPAGDARAAAAA